MRELIGQILEVIATVEESRPQNRAAVDIARKSVVIKVAFAHGIDQRTVSDKYRRQLGLDGTKDFDDLLADWLLTGSYDLKTVLLERAESQDENVAIRQVFRWRIRRVTIKKEVDKWLVQIAPDVTSGTIVETRFDAYTDALDWIVKNTK